MSELSCYCSSVLSLAGSCLNCIISEDTKVTVQTHNSVRTYTESEDHCSLTTFAELHSTPLLPQI